MRVWKTERIKIRRNLGGVGGRKKKKIGHQRPATQLHNKLESKGSRKVYKIEKYKKLEAKD